LRPDPRSTADNPARGRALRSATGTLSPRAAVSFIEVMVVVVMLSLCVVPFLTFFQREARGTAHTISRTIGLALAGHVMERYRNVPYDLLKDGFSGPKEGSTSVIDDDPLLKLDDGPADFKDKLTKWSYKRMAEFKEVPGKPNLGLLTVTVTWKEPNLPAGSTTLSKVVLNYPEL
jgi:hypothetical protein